MNINSHNIEIQAACTHYDNNGNKIKSITFPAPEMYNGESNIELTLYEQDGTIKDNFVIPFRSFNNNFAAYLYSRAAQVNLVYIDTGGTTRSVGTSNNYTLYGQVNNSNYGIQVGASGSAEATQSIDTFKLAGLITHGTALGQLTYAAQTADTQCSLVSGSYMFSTFRTFTNNTAGNVNIKEVGLTIYNVSNTHYFMIARDVIDSNGDEINITLSPTQVLTVKYNFYFPASGNNTMNFANGLYGSLTSNIGAGTSKFFKLIYYDGDRPAYVSRPSNYAYYIFNYIIANATKAYGGVCVGTGSSAFTVDDFNLKGWITHGSGSSQEILHGDTQVDPIVKTYSSSGSACEFIVKRTFTNAGTDPVTIREMGLVSTYWASSTSPGDGLLVSDKILTHRTLTGDQVVPSGSSIEMSYKFMFRA